MAREIKFRVFHKEMFTEKPSMIYDVQNNLEDYIEDRDYILMQYTGLKDKNGKEIYEGDIVKFQNGDNQYVCEVRWKKGSFELHDIEYKHNDFDQLWMIEKRNLEVIGNIYENPELLK